MPLIACTEARHAAAILDIFNHAIVHSTALYDYKPRTAESMAGWFETKRRNDFPVLGIEDEAGCWALPRTGRSVPGRPTSTASSTRSTSTTNAAARAWAGAC